ncbi:MAG: polysaccharide deacetylase family protein [PVC group bacterium]
MGKGSRTLRKVIPVLSAPAARISRLVRGGGVRILMYHRVADCPGDRLSVSPGEFARQMDFLLGEGYRVETLSGALAGRDEGKTVLVLTFDDGYLDFYDTAFPVLKQRRLPALVFVVPGFIDGPVALERYRTGPKQSRPLSWEMLDEMRGYGIAVGSHSLSHRELTGLPAPEAEREIAGSASRIGERLGVRPEWFSYPRGKHTPDLAARVRTAGYRGAVTVRPGTNRRPYDLFRLRRTEVSRDDDLGDFRMKIEGAFDLWHHLWQKAVGEGL